MSRRLLLATVLTALLLPSMASAQSAAVSLVVDRPIVALNGTANVQLVVQDAGKVAGSPKFPRVDGFMLTANGSSSAFSMTRGSVTQSVTYSYVLTARTIGDWELGPAEVSVNGKTLRSNTLQLKVIKSAPRGSGQAAAPPPGSQHYARAQVSDNRPFVGESLTWTLEVGSSAQIRKPGIGALPDFGSLSSEPGIEPQWETEMTIQDGRRVEVWRAGLPVFALESGATKVAPAQVVLPEVVRGNGMFARVREVPLETGSIAVNVRPLPAGRPSNFSGAVGQFQLRASLDSTSVATGETVTLTLQLDGVGALRAPEVDVALPDSVKIYDEDPDVQVALVGDEVHSRAIFRKALVPLKPGRVRIPPIAFSYFDPAKGKYADARSRPLALTVTGDAVAAPALARSEGIAHGKEEVEILASDILPLRTGDRILGDTRRSITSPLVLSLLLLPLVSLGGLLGFHTRRRMAGTDRGQRAARTKEAKSAAKRARDAGRDGDWEEADSALRDWLSTRLDRPGEALSESDAASVLTNAGAPEDIAGGLAHLIRRVEETRYGGADAGVLAEDIAEWIVWATREWRS